jgi:Tol biopolymer transport system component
VACILRDGTANRWKLSLVSFDDGRLVRQFPVEVLPQNPGLRWTPDGRLVTYVVTRDGVSNLWGQPADGGDARQLTAWTADRIFRFDWSRDGTLVCERGTVITDVILIRDAAPTAVRGDS